MAEVAIIPLTAIRNMITDMDALSQTSSLQLPSLTQPEISSPSLSIQTPTTEPTSPFPLLSLPPELRHQIYTHLFTQSSLNITITSTPNASRHHTGHYTPTVQHKSTIPTSILQASKQLYTETHPVLQSTLHLHIVIDPPPHCSFIRPDQPTLSDHLPPSALSQLRKVTYEFPLPSTWGSLTQDRPVQSAFPFSLVPNLGTFAVRKQFHVNLDMLLLYDEVKNRRGRRMSREVYEALSEERKVGVWTETGLLDGNALVGTAGRFGCGGWVSLLLLPERYARGREEVETDVEEATARARKELEVPLGCDVVVEADITLFAGQSWGPAHIETLAVEVGAADRKVRSVKFYSCRRCPAGGTRRFTCDGRGGERVGAL